MSESKTPRTDAVARANRNNRGDWEVEMLKHAHTLEGELQQLHSIAERLAKFAAHQFNCRAFMGLDCSCGRNQTIAEYESVKSRTIQPQQTLKQ